jgi:outer membrane lipoprotein-sorting protein
MRAPTCTDLARLARALVLALLACAALAQEPEPWTLDQLMHALAQRDHGRADFVEAKYMRLLSRPLTLRGTLAYRAPDWLEKRTTDPNEEILQVDGERLRIDIPGRRIHREFALRELPAVWGFVESLRATLRGDRAALERFYRVELDGEVRHWVLTLQPRDPKMAAMITQIRMSGAGGRLASFEIVEARGDRSVMKIREPQS